MSFKSILIVLSFITFCINAQTKTIMASTFDIVKLYDKSKPAAKANLNQLKWLKGTWVGDMNGIEVEHVILDEQGSQISGFVRSVENNNTIRFYEITLFAKVGESVSYRVKHFSSDLKGWEPQNEFVDRPLVDHNPGTLYFDGITFKKTGENSFTVYFLIQHGENKGDILEIFFKRKIKEQAIKHKKKDFRSQLKILNNTFIKAAKIGKFNNVKHVYTEDAILIAEYQPLIQGRKNIESYYTEIFNRQQIKTYTKEINEIIDLDGTLVEIGTFIKVFKTNGTGKELEHKGKYWNIWQVLKNDSLKLKGEAFGFFHPIENPASLMVSSLKNSSNKQTDLGKQKIPLELKAYKALGEKGVRNRDGVLRAQMYTDNAKFMPFADTTKTGMSELKPYMIEYNRGDVKIDSINTGTFYYENHDTYILEYSKFHVRWSMPNFSGTTEGKGIKIWRREEDNSLKIYRIIGSHNHLE